LHIQPFELELKLFEFNVQPELSKIYFNPNLPNRGNTDEDVIPLT